MSAITNISLRALLIAGVLALALTALFTRSATPGITFALEDGLNLTIDSSASMNGVPIPGSTWALKDLVPGADKFFNLADVMPGDSGEATISMHLESDSRQDSWLCLDFTNLQSSDNGVNEPESAEDANGAASGELADGLEFFAWRDDGDNIFEVGEQPLFGTSTQSASAVLNAKTYPVADSTTGPSVPRDSTRYVGIAWCAGDLTVDLGSGQVSCAPSLGNAAQTDSLSVDVVLRAATERNNSAFTCEGGGESGRGRGERPERPERPERESNR